MLEDLKTVVSKFFKLTNRLIRTREKYHSLVQQVQQIQREKRCQLESNHIRFQNQESLTTKLERLSVERWCLNLKARGTDMKKSLYYMLIGTLVKSEEMLRRKGVRRSMLRAFGIWTNVICDSCLQHFPGRFFRAAHSPCFPRLC